jgi:A/G-specific adenine glycosylase
MPPDHALIRQALLAWYDGEARSLPWRVPPRGRAAGVAPDPYRVWLSEVMLQQTTVPHATPYFLDFTRRWPTVRDLAAAPDAEVMAAWAGLGYYARARNLLACARAVARDHGGVFPSTESGLLALPGIGAYTAAAVAAIAFNQAANVADGNIERVMARLFAVETPLPAAKPELKRLAAGFVASDRPGDWAQALMDLGAMICRPKAPLCDRCPISAHCRAFASGEAETWPRRTAKADRPHRHGAAFVLIRRSEVALLTRPPKGLLGGMLATPTSAWRAARWSRDEALAVAPEGRDWRAIGAIDHVFTHFSLTLEVYRGEGGGEGLAWTPIDEAIASTPSVFSKVLRLAV